ncbi:MAG: hypothetical protein ABI700_24670 [Chloroflexota bacterium]
MSEDQLYELARKRIDRKNRRWILWGLNMVAWLIFMGVFIALKGAISIGIGISILVVWAGLLIFHGVILGVTQGRDEEIEKEVARLRNEIYDEKPKHLELGEDGELLETIDEPEQHIKRS